MVNGSIFKPIESKRFKEYFPSFLLTEGQISVNHVCRRKQQAYSNDDSVFHEECVGHDYPVCMTFQFQDGVGRENKKQPENE